MREAVHVEDLERIFKDEALRSSLPRAQYQAFQEAAIGNHLLEQRRLRTSVPVHFHVNLTPEVTQKFMA